jgi:hypothetical protein
LFKTTGYKMTPNHKEAPHLQSTTSYYGFLPACADRPDGSLWVADDGLRPELHERLRRLQPGVLAALERKDYAAALSLAYSTLETLAHGLRPTWADTLPTHENDRALIQALLVEIERFPLIAREDTTLRELQGTAVWVSHRAWTTTRAEALAIAHRLATTLGLGLGYDAAGDGDCPLQVSGVGDRAALWTRAWV